MMRRLHWSIVAALFATPVLLVAQISESGQRGASQTGIVRSVRRRLTFTQVAYGSNGVRMAGHGEGHFGWILGGRAVEDVWTGPLDSAPPGAPPPEHGTRGRFYDPSINAWRVVWSAPPAARGDHTP